MDEESSTLNILLVGDAGVGKSTLIASFISKSFTSPALSPHKGTLNDQRISSAIPSSNFSLHIIDSGGDSSDSDLQNKIGFADVVLIAYDTQRLETLDNVTQRWIPLVQNNERNVTEKKILIAGLKAEADAILNEAMAVKELTTLPSVLDCLRCSALQGEFDRVFSRAELSYLYPHYPLYDSSTCSLRSKCSQVIERIFRIYDLDGDGVLSIKEINKLQALFTTQFTAEEFALLCKKIEAIDPSGVSSKGLTVLGLKLVMKMFLQKNQAAKVWTVLRHFGYDDELDIEIPDEFDIPVCSRYNRLRLSPEAVFFVTRLTTCISLSLGEIEDNVSPLCLDKFFSVVDVFTVPWKDKFNPIFYVNKTILFDEWIASWHLYFDTNPIECFKLLFMLGYDNRRDIGVSRTPKLAPPSIFARMFSQKVLTEDRPIRAAILAFSPELFFNLKKCLGLSESEGDRVDFCSFDFFSTMRSTVYLSYSLSSLNNNDIILDNYDVIIIPYSCEDVAEVFLSEKYFDTTTPRIFLSIHKNDGYQVHPKSNAEVNSRDSGISSAAFDGKLSLNPDNILEAFDGAVCRVVQSPKLFIPSRSWKSSFLSLVLLLGSSSIVVVAVYVFVPHSVFKGLNRYNLLRSN